MEPRVGKGSPTLATFGTVVGLTGGAVLFAGVVLLVASFVNFAQSAYDIAGTYALVGGIMTASGLTAGALGVYLLDHNKAPTAHIHLLPNGLTGTF